MENTLQSIVQTLQEKFEVNHVEEFRGEVHVFVAPARIVEALTHLRDNESFELMSAMTAVDYWPQEDPRFNVICQLTSVSRDLSLQVRVPVAGSGPRVPTVSGVYASANWREREIFDMFGITFEGHPDLRRILMPFDWVGHPLRRDFPLGYEEPQFTFNFDEISLQKPNPEE
ncbi:MAG: NADH-quinone oxidoreductase subunit C [Chloroflexota bacterium]